jgi:hypothetical protein
MDVPEHLKDNPDLTIDNIPALKEKEKENETEKVKTKEFAEMLHDSLHQKIFSLQDKTLVFPAHYDKLIKGDILVTSSLEDIKKIKNLQELFGLTKGDFAKRIISSNDGNVYSSKL